MTWRNLAWILGIAALWKLGGAILEASLTAISGLSFVLPCASASMIMGMLLLLVITIGERAHKIFYEQIYDDEDDSITGLPLLVGLPVSLIVGGLIMWLTAKFLGA